VVKTELVFAEIGDHACSVDRIHFQKFFLEAEINIITEGQCIGDRNHPRWGWRMNDYHKVRGLFESKADIAIAFDGDMRIVSNDVKDIEDLVSRFGLCLPANPRKIVKLDNSIGVDSAIIFGDEKSLLSMHAVNCGIIALDTSNERAMRCVDKFLNIMRDHPVRGPTAWAKAFRDTGFSPCLLPPQWCVCAEDVGIGNEIVLHTGHQKVKEYYANII